MKSNRVLSKLNLLFLILFLSNYFFSINLFSQCTNSFSYGSSSAPTNATPITISTCTFQGDYNTITGVTAGTTYSSTYSLGGCITVHSGSYNGPVVAWGSTPLSWTATVSGTYYIHYNTNCSCGTASSCGTSTISCTSCAAGSNPCTTIPSISACNTSVTASLSGSGAGWNVTACGWTTSGDEQIYSFTPTTTGTYSLNITSTSGGYIDYFWVNSTAGCSSTAGWNCITATNFSGTYGSMSWTAGQTYYILLDPEGTGSYSSTFSLTCPAASPCTSITNIAACGSSVTANLSGTGAGWSVTACGWTTGGDEQIYSFTPATTGTYSLNITSASGGYIDYFWVNSTSGCSSTAGWNCIAATSGTGSFGSMNWTAGQTYYILVDPEGSGSYSTTFSIPCPSAGPCASSPTNIVGCGASYAVSLTGAGAWNITPCGWTTTGLEAIYTYTATTTGNHTVNVTSLSGIADFAYKPVSSGCSNSGWTCIDDFLFTGTSPAFSMTAGVQYYILVDPEGTGTTTVTFNLDCPGSVVTASDCNSYVNICSNANFQIDPNGYGSVMEIPALGTVGNPYNTNPGGSGNAGCLQAATPELNSTWMVINVATSGNLEFSFGAGGAQAGYYDWIMYPYTSTTCSQIPTGTYAPVRCNWNWASSGGTGLSSAANMPSGGNSGNYEPPLAVNAGERYIICFSNYSSAVTSVPLNFFGTATVSCTPLPVELLTLKGEPHLEGVSIDWETASEYNVSHYWIEHSTDMINFEKVGYTEASNFASSVHTYNFLHENPMEGTNYYRINMVDLNSDFVYSNVISVNFSSDNFSIEEIYPNPSDDQFNISVSSEEEITIHLEVTDVTGKLIAEIPFNLTKGSNSLQLNASNYPKGLYFLNFTGEMAGIQKVHRIVKQ